MASTQNDRRFCYNKHRLNSPAVKFMSLRRLSPLDGLLLQVDHALRTLVVDAPAHERSSPAKEAPEQSLSDEERRHAAGLMRVNHTLTAKLTSVRSEMEQAANEEIDHLAWCQERVKQLGSHSSVLNPLWYGLSFGIGATAGLISDKLSLGFVSATENQVCQHLEHHLKKLPPKDEKSRAIVAQMLIDEEKHAHAALSAGGLKFPAPIKGLMTLLSKAMTETSYRI